MLSTKNRFVAAQIPEGVLDGEDLESGSREEIEVLRPAMTDVKSAARASGEIERLHEILLRENLEGPFSGRA